jgi:hypothetical protein
VNSAEVKDLHAEPLVQMLMVADLPVENRLNKKLREIGGWACAAIGS